MDWITLFAIIVISMAVLTLGAMYFGFRLIKENPIWILAIVLFVIAFVFLFIPDPFFIEIIAGLAGGLVTYYQVKKK